MKTEPMTAGKARLREQIETLEAELAAVKAAPVMQELEALRTEIEPLRQLVERVRELEQQAQHLMT